MGEVAAAYVAGALSLEDAALVICTRSKLVKRTVGQGAMASVELSIDDAGRAIAGYEDRVSIAVSTSPTSTVLSGDPAALTEILEQLQGRDVFCRMVKVDFASHSPQMDPLRGELLQALEEVRPQLASVPIYSTVLDSVADGSELDALYWARNLKAGAFLGVDSAPARRWLRHFRRNQRASHPRWRNSAGSSSRGK